MTVRRQGCSEITRRERHGRIRKRNGTGTSSTETCERDPKSFSRLFEVAAQAPVDSAFSSLAAKTTISKQRPLAGKQVTKGQSPFASAEKPSTSTHETPTQSTYLFGFGQGSAATPSHLFGTPFRPVEIGSPNAEPAIRKATAPRVNPGIAFWECYNWRLGQSTKVFL